MHIDRVRKTYRIMQIIWWVLTIFLMGCLGGLQNNFYFYSFCFGLIPYIIYTIIYKKIKNKYKYMKLHEDIGEDIKNKK